MFPETQRDIYRTGNEDPHLPLRLFFVVVLGVLLAAIAWNIDARGDRPTSRLTQNVVVGAPTKASAIEATEVAERFRQEFCNEWLGYEIATGEGFANVHLAMAEQDKARTWLKDFRAANNRNSMVWVEATSIEAFWPQLRHEIAHVLLHEATKGLAPVWLHEGIASLYDDQERKEIRVATVAQWCAASRHPRLCELLSRETVSTTEHYASAESFVDYAKTIVAPQEILQFAQLGEATNYYRASDQHFGMSLEDLERGWHRHMAKQSTK